MSGDGEIARVKRSAAPLRRAFVERTGSGGTALTALLSGAALGRGDGARGGRLRVALLLTLLWATPQAPYRSTRSARAWAELVGLADADGSGARAVREALGELAALDFVRVDDHDGRLEVELLHELGTGEAYTFPAPAQGEPYFRVPRALWEDGVIGAMSGRALAMYLVCLSLAGWSNREFLISTSLLLDRYGLDETTRKRGLRELVDLGVLASRAVPMETGAPVRNAHTIEPAFRITGSDTERH